jgi:hypothetical protein
MRAMNSVVADAPGSATTRWLIPGQRKVPTPASPGATKIQMSFDRKVPANQETRSRQALFVSADRL